MLPRPCPPQSELTERASRGASGRTTLMRSIHTHTSSAVRGGLRQERSTPICCVTDEPSSHAFTARAPPPRRRVRCNANAAVRFAPPRDRSEQSGFKLSPGRSPGEIPAMKRVLGCAAGAAPSCAVSSLRRSHKLRCPAPLEDRCDDPQRCAASRHGHSVPVDLDNDLKHHKVRP